MGKAYSSDLAWRVVWQLWDADQWDEFVPDWLARQTADPEWGLCVSKPYVDDVWRRYWWTGDVETHQVLAERIHR